MVSICAFPISMWVSSLADKARFFLAWPYICLALLIALVILTVRITGSLKKTAD